MDRLNRMDNQIEQTNSEQHVTSTTNPLDSSSVVHDPMSIHEHILANVSDLVQEQNSTCDEMMKYNLDNAPNGEICCPRSLHSAETVCYFSSDEGEGSSVPIKNTNRGISEYDTDSMEGFANEDTQNNVRRIDSINSTIHGDEIMNCSGCEVSSVPIKNTNGDISEFDTDSVEGFANEDTQNNVNRIDSINATIQDDETMNCSGFEGSSVPIENTNRDISEYDTDFMEGFANEDAQNNVNRIDYINATIQNDETMCYNGFSNAEKQSKTDEISIIADSQNEVISFGNTEVVQNQSLPISDSWLSHVENQDVPNEIVMNQVVANDVEPIMVTDEVVAGQGEFQNVPKIDENIVTNEIIDVDLWCANSISDITKVHKNQGSPYGESSRTVSVVKKRNTPINYKKKDEAKQIVKTMAKDECNKNGLVSIPAEATSKEVVTEIQRINKHPYPAIPIKYDITKVRTKRGSPYGESSRTGTVAEKPNTPKNHKTMEANEVIDIDLWYDGKFSDTAKQCKNQDTPKTNDTVIDVVDLVSLHGEASCSYTNVPEKSNNESSSSNKVVVNRVISDGEIPSVSRTLTKRQDEDFKTGDLIWAKMGKYPFWPSVVCIDPSSMDFLRGSKSKRSCFVHVRFCNDCGRRSWVRVTHKYAGRADLLEKYPNCLAVYRTNRKQMDLWEGAVEEADSWINCSREERLNLFSEKYKLPIDTLEFKDDAHYIDKNNLRPCYVYIEDFRKENGKRNLESLTINDPDGKITANSNNVTTDGTKKKKAKKTTMPKDKSDNYGLVSTSDEDTSKEEVAIEIPRISSHPHRIVPIRVKRSISGAEEEEEERLKDRPIKIAVRRLNKTKNAQTNKK